MVRSIKERRRLPPFVVEYEVNGTPYVYFRKKGQKDIRMRGTPYSEEWLALYEQLKSGELPPEKEKLQPPKDGTLAWLCQRYFESTEFGALDVRTQRVRRQILQTCLDEPVRLDKPDGSKFGAMPLARVTAKNVAILRDRKKDLPEAANGRVKAIRAVFTWAGRPEEGLVQTNPARDVQYRASANPEGHHSWIIEEVEKFEARHPIGTKARLAMALLLYTGQRRSDIVLFGKQNERNGWLRFTQQKNKRNKPVSLEIPIRPELRAILDASPTGDMVYLVTEFGKPFSPNGFGNWFRDRCEEAGVPGRAHGLRKACATRLADNGASAHEIMAITGHKTMKEVERYTRAANQKRLAESASKR